MQKVISCLMLAVLSYCLPAALVAQDMSLAEILIPDGSWELIGEGYKFTEGPAADAQGNVYFTDVPTNTIYKIDLQDNITVFDDQAERTSGLYFGPGGKLYACRMGGKKIVVYDLAKDPQAKAEVLAENVGVNDLVVDLKGGVYFTDPGNQRVMYLDPSRKLHVAATNLKPNGIILSPRAGTLVVTENDHPWLWTFRVETNGTLSARGPQFGVVQVPEGEKLPKSDGMIFDDDGRLYLASAAGLQVFDTQARPCGTILKPQKAFLSNVVFGGKNFDTLYVTCQDKVYKRKTQVKGKPDWLR